MTIEQLQKDTELVLACITKVEDDYYSKIKVITDNTKIYDYPSYTDFGSSLSDVYSDTCAQLLGIVMNFMLSDVKSIFTFEHYVEKRKLLKIHNDSIADKFYCDNIQLFV